MKKNCFAILMVALFLNFGLSAQTMNYYFGNIHAHSSYSDGNKDSSTSLSTTPLQDFNYAKASQHIDFYGIAEHNHLSAGMSNPINFHKGVAYADSATTDGSFIAMYGMEWGVISGGGHVIIYGYDSLIGWDANDYDVYVAQDDYTNLWKKVNQKPGAFAYLAHPQTTDYNNLFSTPLDLHADSAIIGMAARSGPAFSTNTTYTNPPSGDYISRYNDALKLGYHVGIGLDHDTHYTVFGRSTAGRLVVLAPSLTRANILDALRNMRFYSSDDWNTKVAFNIGTHSMGSIFAHAGSPALTATITDPDAAESVTSIAIYYGIPGSGTAPTVLTTVSSSSSLSYTHTITNNSTYYYYLKITQADGDIIWTSPIWYTRNDAIVGNPPVANFTPSGTSVCAGQHITYSDNSTNTPTTWNWTFSGGVPNTSSAQNPVISYSNPGTYTVILTAANASGTNTVTRTNYITVNPIPTISATPTSSTICAGTPTTISATGATSYSWSPSTGLSSTTGSSVSANPTSTTTYTVTGTASGCSNTASTTITVNPIPTISATPTNPTICAGITTTISASGATSYSWSPSTGLSSTTGNSVSANPTSTRTYTITGTALGCSNTTSTTITVQNCSGINELSDNLLKMYPNPVNDLLTLEVNTPSYKTIEISDASGRIILSKKGNNTVFSVETSSFEAGIYFVNIYIDGAYYSTKNFVVERK